MLCYTAAAPLQKLGLEPTMGAADSAMLQRYKMHWRKSLTCHTAAAARRERCGACGKQQRILHLSTEWQPLLQQRNKQCLAQWRTLIAAAATHAAMLINVRQTHVSHSGGGGSAKAAGHAGHSSASGALAASSTPWCASLSCMRPSTNCTSTVLAPPPPLRLL